MPGDNLIDNGWKEWSKHVLAELERLNDNYSKLDSVFNSEFRKISVEIAMLKVKSGIWGLIGGTIPILITLILLYLKGE